jgi:Ala-tRNA(Pro) deacylase
MNAESNSHFVNQDIYNSIISLLNENNISYRIEEHVPPYTCATEGKAILMKIDEAFHLLSYTASRRINSKLIKKFFACKKMRFATSEELFDKFKLVPGSVPTFGEPILPVKLFLDKHMITNQQEITLSMGSVYHYAIMNMSDYLKVAKYETFDFSEEQELSCP